MHADILNEIIHKCDINTLYALSQVSTALRAQVRACSGKFVAVFRELCDTEVCDWTISISRKILTMCRISYSDINNHSEVFKGAPDHIIENVLIDIRPVKNSPNLIMNKISTLLGIICGHTIGLHLVSAYYLSPEWVNITLSRATIFQLNVIFTIIERIGDFGQTLDFAINNIFKTLETSVKHLYKYIRYINYQYPSNFRKYKQIKQCEGLRRVINALDEEKRGKFTKYIKWYNKYIIDIPVEIEQRRRNVLYGKIE